MRVLDFPGDDIPIRLQKRGGRYEFTQPKTSKINYRFPIQQEPVCDVPRESRCPDKLELFLVNTILTLQALQHGEQDNKKDEPEE